MCWHDQEVVLNVILNGITLNRRTLSLGQNRPAIIGKDLEKSISPCFQVSRDVTSGDPVWH
jgi:hypothetical protein